MTVKIAEYLGQKTEIESPIIQPAKKGAICPFMDDTCIKLDQGNKPICTVRKKNGDLWIVCRHRLCATKNKIPLIPYQKEVLMTVAKCLFGEDVTNNDIAIRREQSIPVVGKSKYHADYIMINKSNNGNKNGQKKVILEMQGGGETSKTGSITRLTQLWEENLQRLNSDLTQFVDANPIVTNAWRRQQEQFIIKGNIANQTGGGIAFCVGKPIFDYLWERLKNANMTNLKDHNWTVALITFKEEKSDKPGPIKFVIDKNRVLFTTYITFVQTLINQGKPHPEMFKGEFELLNGLNFEVTN